MTLIQMRYFYEVCRLQNISKAASFLHVSQPTISVALADLEKNLNLKLFTRDGKKLELTPEGQIVLNKISPILKNLEQMDKEFEALANKQNKIKFAVPLQIGVRLLPLLYEEFPKEYPGVELEIIEVGGVQAMQMLEDGEIDLAISNYDTKYYPNLHYILLKKNEACFCTSELNPLALKKYIDIPSLQEEPFVLLNGGFVVNRILNETFQDYMLSPRVILHTAQLSTVKNLVSRGIASTFLMKQAILPGDGIVPISLERPIYINSGIILAKGKRLSKSEEKLVQFIKNNLARI